MRFAFVVAGVSIGRLAAALYMCASVCMSALWNKNHWTCHHQTWQMNSTQVLVNYFIWGQKVKSQGHRVNKCNVAIVVATNKLQTRSPEGAVVTGLRQIFWSRNGAPVNAGHRRNANTVSSLPANQRRLRPYLYTFTIFSEILIMVQYMLLACTRHGQTPAYTYRTRYQFECDVINAKVFLPRNCMVLLP